MDEHTWLTPFIPAIEAVVSVVGTALMGIIAGYVWQRWGIDIDGKHRKTIQTAATNAAGLMVAGAPLDQAIAYVESHAADAVAHFGAKQNVIGDIIKAKLPQVAVTAAKLDKTLSDLK